MTKKNKIIFAAALAVLMLLLACCGKKPETQQTEPAAMQGTPMVYTGELCSDSGYPLEGIGVYVYTDETQQELVWFARTDAEGKINFRDVTCEGYVAILDGVSEDYAVEENYPLTGTHTLITVEALMQSDVDLAATTRELGDVMFDFTITDCDGVEHTLSELLMEKDAVVLNFWYLNCGPCKQEFPYLQEAYEEYSDRIEVLAMNPVDGTDETIAAFKEELELTFPMAACEPEWATAMQLTAYPTTVIIDRYGMISLVHTGSITSTKVFTDAFAHFVDEEYEQGVVENIEETETEVPGTNSSEPIELGGVLEFEATIPAGSKVYYNLYRVDGTLTVKESDVYATYNGKTYGPKSGGFSFSIKSPDTYSPAKLTLGNSGDENLTIMVKIVKPGGVVDNPYSAKLNKEFTTKVAKGNDQGVYYQITASKSGYLVFECLESPKKVSEFDYVMQNLSTNAQRTLKEDGNEDGTMVSIQVKKGQKVKCWIVAEKDTSGNKYPGGTFKSKLYMSDTPVTEETEQVQKIDYKITVKDENGDPVGGVKLNVDLGDGKPHVWTTNSKGVATEELAPGTYEVVLTIPDGYTAEETEVTLTKDKPTATIKLETKKEAAQLTYTVTILNKDGKPAAGTVVMIGTKAAVTDAKGKVTFTLPEDTHTVTITKEDGTVINQTFEAGKTDMTIDLSKAEPAETEPEETEPAETEPEETEPAETEPEETEPDHEHSYTSAVTAPTCIRKGYTTYTCGCGDSYIADEVAAIGHDYKSETVGPTTTAQGYTLHTCNNCGDSYKDSYVSKLPTPEHEHSYAAAVTAPTCTRKGYTTYTCQCGDSYIADEVVATGHDYKSETVAPTTSAQGYTQHTCNNCGDSYKDSYVDKLPEESGSEHEHSYVAAVTASTCTRKGYTTYTCECGDSYITEEVAATGHDYKSEIVASTVTAQGYTKHTCNNCGDSYKDTYTPKHQHSYAPVVTAPTCTRKGYTTYQCQCGDSYIADEVAMTGHDYKSEVVAPTTTAQGYTQHTCNNCGDSYKDTYVPKHVHSYSGEVTEPTCTDKGYTTYTCACGDSYTADEVAATGHDYKTETIEPTTTTQGYTLYTCNGCGDSYKDNYVDPLPETVTYTVTVTDYAGKAQSGVIVQYLQNGQVKSVKTTNSSGMASAELEGGSYEAALVFTGDPMYYDDSATTLTESKTSLTIKVTGTVAKNPEDNWFGTTYIVDVGATYVEKVQANVETFYAFEPEEEGTYRVSVAGDGATVNHYGSINFPNKQEMEGATATSYELNIKGSNLGATYAICVTGATKYILVIERISDAQLDETDIPWEEYDGEYPTKKHSEKVSQNMTYVDLTGKTSNFTPVLGDDGYYHLNSEDGKLLFVNLGVNARYISMYNMLGVSGVGGTKFGQVFRNEDGTVQLKEDYTNCMIAYVTCRSPQNTSSPYEFEVYPLTEDLMYMLQNGGEHMGWWDASSADFLFGDLGSDFNPELGWMFAVCY